MVMLNHIKNQSLCILNILITNHIINQSFCILYMVMINLIKNQSLCILNIITYLFITVNELKMCRLVFLKCCLPCLS